jgi:hypothetical protein
VNMIVAQTATATFDLSGQVCYSLTYVVKPAGSGTVTVAPDPDWAGEKYSAGTAVTLTATPAPKYVFSKWTGSIVSKDNPLTIVMDEDKTLTTNFKKQDNIFLFSENRLVVKISSLFFVIRLWKDILRINVTACRLASKPQDGGCTHPAEKCADCHRHQARD